ncbi:uncharacterized protein ARMOST_17846 [Armillaria ostoyae]|uniref:Uncharacterized protein n=1 Tax=Armillaria ostoyae TaxID=47428 RepID=A0A284S059_ARMOS|nr:uncharacterized protein ARMOST_17846 [Armillaria ostoyae]
MIGSGVIAYGLNTSAHKEMSLRVSNPVFNGIPSNFLQLNPLAWWHAMIFSSFMHYGCSFPSCTHPDHYTQRFTDQDVGFYADHWNKLFEDITKRAGRLAPGSFPVLLPA